MHRPLAYLTHYWFLWFWARYPAPDLDTGRTAYRIGLADLCRR